MGQTIQQALVFLVQTVVSLYAIVLILRIMMRAVHADYYNPLVHMVTKLTDFPIRKLRKLLPDISVIETVSVVFVFIVLLVKAMLIIALSGLLPHLFACVLYAFGNLFALIIQVVFYSILLRSILTWLPQAQPGIQLLLAQLTEPYMAPVRRWIPLVGGLDLSPIALLIMLQLLIMVVANPLMQYALSLVV